MNNVKTELKTLNGNNANTAVTKIQEAFKQGPTHVIIDARNTTFTKEQAHKIIERATGSYANKKLPGVVQIYTKEGLVIGGKR